jgi:hypothetical protein
MNLQKLHTFISKKPAGTHAVGCVFQTSNHVTSGRCLPELASAFSRMAAGKCVYL